MHRIERDKKCYILFDEVQTVPDFERELKAIYDLEESLYFIGSGSNSLLVKHRSGALSGRHGRIHLRPMDFNEFLNFMNYHPKPSEAYLMENYLEEYIETGGIPEYILTRDPHYLEDLVEDVIYKDILPRYNIRNPRMLMDLFFLLCQRAGQKMTPSKLSRILKVTPDTISNYISYLEEAFLIELVEKEGTPNERKYSPKKVYINDQGILSNIGMNVPIGSKVENLTFLALNDERIDPTYLDIGGKEIDLLINGTAYEIKYKDRLDEDDIRPIKELRSSKVKKKVIISKKEQIIEGIEVKRIIDLVLVK
jgi:predicted AAA+ superfamily ATPase